MMNRKIKNNVSWVGKIDWELESFHGADYSINSGSSQNAYLIREGKNVLIDTVWQPHSTEFLDHLAKAIPLDQIDFIVANHGEIDHSGALPALLEKYPAPRILYSQCRQILDWSVPSSGMEFQGRQNRGLGRYR